MSDIGDKAKDEPVPVVEETTDTPGGLARKNLIETVNVLSDGAFQYFAVACLQLQQNASNGGFAPAMRDEFTAIGKAAGDYFDALR